MKKTNKGFTIIEVVLVLAIAGLIFLIVFLALPALQKSQRDTQRRSDIGRLIAGVQSYQANNSGKLTTDLGGAGGSNIIGSTYMSTFADPSGGTYSLVVKTAGTPAAPTPAPSNDVDGKLTYYPGVDCANTTKGSASPNATSFAVIVKLESGGTYCANN